MNERQRESVAKYLYDVSKGLLLAAVIAGFTGKASILLIAVHMVMAAYAFAAAYLMEGRE